MSLPAELTGHLTNRLEIEFSERDIPFKIEMNGTIGKYNAAGMLGSSGMIHAVLDQARIEFKARAHGCQSLFSNDRSFRCSARQRNGGRGKSSSSSAPSNTKAACQRSCLGICEEIQRALDQIL
jgi:hypothetical protein